MPQNQHVQKPYKVLAEQYFAATTPEPVGVCHCTVTMEFPTGLAHVHAFDGIFAPQDGDWIAEDVWQPHAFHVIPDAEFQDRFGGA